MEPGTHYLAKLELIIMFHGALRKFRDWNEERGGGTNERPGDSSLKKKYEHSTISSILDILKIYTQRNMTVALL